MFGSPHRATRSTSRALLVLPAALVLALPACGGSSSGDDGAAPSPAGDAFPVTVTGADGDLTLEERPEAIVSISPSATEMLFAIGAGDQVEAVDDNSNYPEDAPVSELSSFTPNAEAIAKYEPDLVVLSDDLNGIVDSLDALSVPTLLLPAAESLDDSYEQLEVLGDATGNAEEADEVVADMRDRIAAAAESVPAEAQGTRVYHELDPTFYTATSTTFIGSVYAQLGLENIADGAPDAAGGYPQLSPEYIAGQAPGLIVLADTKCCEVTAESVAERPAFGTLPAVQEGRILEADDDIASRWGPRVADFAEAVAGALQG